MRFSTMRSLLALGILSFLSACSALSGDKVDRTPVIETSLAPIRIPAVPPYTPLPAAEPEGCDPADPQCGLFAETFFPVAYENDAQFRVCRIRLDNLGQAVRKRDAIQGRQSHAGLN